MLNDTALAMNRTIINRLKGSTKGNLLSEITALIEALQNPFAQVGFFAVQALNRIGTDSAKQAIIDNLISHRWDTSLNIERPY